MLTRFTVFTLLRSIPSSPHFSRIRSSNLQPLYQCAMSTSSNFHLNPSIFNRTLYDRVTETWFQDLGTSGHEFHNSIVTRWFIPTPKERAAFDEVCRGSFSHALEAIGPDAFPAATAQPFVDELHRIAEQTSTENGEEAAWTALSMALLLDQMPRNIYRTNAELPLVYKHYDRMALQLSRTLLSPSSPIPRPDLHPIFRRSAAHRMWFYMPLIHSEDVSDHDLAHGIVAEFVKEVDGLDGYEGTQKFLEGYTKSAKEHREILDRFGRYPHRNGALGRQSTEEEKRFIEEGGATFGVAQEKKEAVL
ncbi:hypothetical protein yc1106_04165 [Curvularia clavata]|uniref:DUF924-domain-containing protein n=1 Tax=Curvularia clavata TaxID=95742 RepID=A0A9Q8Z6V6_CURCL|nr:hypothetical protein yc1106_04165 [Curvularia clavata]